MKKRGRPKGAKNRGVSKKTLVEAVARATKRHMEKEERVSKWDKTSSGVYQRETPLEVEKFTARAPAAQAVTSTTLTTHNPVSFDIMSDVSGDDVASVASDTDSVDVTRTDETGSQQFRHYNSFSATVLAAYSGEQTFVWKDVSP